MQYSDFVPGSELAASDRFRVNCCSTLTPICDVAVTAPPDAGAPDAPVPQSPRSALTNVDGPICLPAPIRVPVQRRTDPGRP